MRAAGYVTFFWLDGGEVTGLCSRNLVLSLKLPSSTWVGTLVLQNSKIVLCVSLEEEPGPGPVLHYCFLAAPPLCLHSLTSLISKSLNLLFGIQEDLGCWNLYPANKKPGTLCTREDPTVSCSVYYQHLSQSKIYNFDKVQFIKFFSFLDCDFAFMTKKLSAKPKVTPIFF